MATLTLLTYDDFTVIGSNWDFLRASDWADWSANVAASPPYYSAPNSLRIDPGNQSNDKYALSTHASAQDIKEGELVGWVSKAFPGVGNAYFYIGVTGSGSLGIRIPVNDPTQPNFTRNKVVWYQGVDGDGDPATVYRLDLWGGSSWSTGVTQYGTAMTGGTNRVGFGCTAQSLGRNKYFDDVMLWLGKAPDAISPYFVWGEGEKLDFIDHFGVKTRLDGEKEGFTGKQSYQLTVQGIKLAWIDINGDEHRATGEKTGFTSKSPYQIAVQGSKIGYIDEDGNQRHLPTSVLLNNKVFNEVAFNG
jgi:hypothetical protein